MDTIQYLLGFVLHIDTHLFTFVAEYGVWTYALLFAIIFCETGLVIFPFLPGDSLLFVAGTIAASPQSELHIEWLMVLLIIASILGNKTNYLIGRMVGPRVFRAKSSWLLNQKHLREAHAFYEKHGGKTIIFARFIPIIRTFAPFVAGIARMSLREFSFYNIISAFLWIGILLSAGYFFGGLPIVKDHFSTVVYGIIAISLIPVITTALKRKSA